MRRRDADESGAGANGAPGRGLMSLTGPDGHARPLAEIESETIRFAISLYGGNLSEAARRLGIGRSTLYRRLGAD